MAAKYVRIAGPAIASAGLSAVFPDDRVVAGDGDADAKLAPARRATGNKKCLLRPRSSITVEYVRRAGVFHRSIVVSVCPDHRVVTGDGDADAKVIVSTPISGHELGLLRPRISIMVEYVRRSGPIATITIRPDNCVVARDGDAGAKISVLRTVTCHELDLLCPRSFITVEYVRRARAVTADPIIIRPDNCVVARDGDGVTEAVVGTPISGHELGLLRPRSSITVEYVRRARVAHGVIVTVVTVCPDHRVVAGDSDADAKVIAGRTISGNELGLLRPASSVMVENVCRPSTGVIPPRPDDRVVTGDGNAVAKPVVVLWITGNEFEVFVDDVTE